MPRVLLLFALALVSAAPAQAATRTVARSGRLSLVAQESGGRLCLTLRRNGHYQGHECGRIPRSPQRALRVFPDVGFDNYAAAVPSSVLVAETDSRSGRRARYRTFGARDFSARFVLIPAPPSAVFVRFYGADGALLGVDAGPAGYIDFDGNRTTVLGEHSEGVEAHTEPRLAPTPDQPDRLRTLACVDVATQFGGDSFCDEQSENGLVLMRSCKEPGLLGGIVAGTVNGVRLTLGSGAEHVVAARDLPAGFGGRRVVAAQVPSGEAVRDAVAVDAAGRGVARAVVGIAPGGQPCRGEDQGDDRFNGPLVPSAPPTGAVPVSSAADLPLLAADQGETLCVGLAQLTAGLCPPAPVDSDQPDLLQRGETVAGALSRDADRITLRLDRGQAVTVSTTDGAAYSGRWAGRVRFFAARIGARRQVTHAVVRNAAGTVIGISDHGIPRPQVSHTILARGHGLGLEFVRRSGEQPCVTALAADLPTAPRFCTDPNPGTRIDGPFVPYSAAITVACVPRRAIAYGRFPDGLRAPRVLLDGNRALRVRTISLRGEDAWVAFLPDAPVRGLRAGRHRVALRLPPASSQCGYSASRSF